MLILTRLVGESHSEQCHYLTFAEQDLSEVETIAERGSMLIWQIEAALERTRLYVMLASATSATLRFDPDTNEVENAESSLQPATGGRGGCLIDTNWV